MAKATRMRRVSFNATKLSEKVSKRVQALPSNGLGDMYQTILGLDTAER